MSKLIVVLFIAVYLFVGWLDARSEGDLANLSDLQKREIVASWSGQ